MTPWFRGPPGRLLAALLLLTALRASPARAQGTLDRSPNVSGDWVVRPGIVQFNFLHRFMRSPAPVRKLTNFPTFLLATSVVRGTMVGFNYASNSTLAPAFPNEWEFFARVAPFTQGERFPVGLGGQVGWNVAADGLDGELALSRRQGPFTVTGVGRALSDPYSRRGKVQWAFGGGAILRLSRHLAVEGDWVRRTELDRARSEKAAWSAGLAIAIPNTPHTLSLHATNTNTATLQGASRGTAQVRYGFEFTIPFTLARYFGHKRPPAPTAASGAPAPGMVPSGPVTGALVKTAMQSLAYDRPRLEIAVGTTIEWKNNDPVAHTVTADDSTFDSGNIEAGQVWRYTFIRPGTYSFHCTPHPFMKGTVIVQ